MRLNFAKLLCLLSFVCVMSQGVQAQVQPQLQIPQPQIAKGSLFCLFVPGVLPSADVAPRYLSFQAYWSSKTPQVTANYEVTGSWFVTFSIQAAQFPRTGQVLQALIVQFSEGQTVSKIYEFSMEGDVNITQEADRTLALILDHTNAKLMPKRPAPFPPPRVTRSQHA